MGFTNTFILLRSEQVWALEWVVLFKDRWDEKGIQSDILQEMLVLFYPSLSVTDSLSDSFINTTTGWINLLLLSSSGPIKIPVGTW
jgi:fatty acid synthase subunit alpha, fungi type